MDLRRLKVDLGETLGGGDDIFGVKSLVDWGGFDVGIGLGCGEYLWYVGWK